MTRTRYEPFDDGEENPYGGFGGSDEVSAPRAARAKRSRAGRDRPVRQPASPRDGTLAPRGYRDDIWDLALLFEQKADGESVSLRAGVPVIYSQIERRMTKMDLPAKVVRSMINLFWWDYVLLDGADPLDQFTGIEMFKGLYEELEQRKSFKSAAERMGRRTKPEPEVRQRKAPAKPRKESILKAHPRNRQENEELRAEVRRKIQERRDQS